MADREKNTPNWEQEKINNDRGDNSDSLEKKENKNEDYFFFFLNKTNQEANIVNEKSKKEITNSNSIDNKILYPNLDDNINLNEKEKQYPNLGEDSQKCENIIINNLKYGNYENFSINQMKRLSRTEIHSNDSKILVLKDGRLLIYYDTMINVYNLNNNNLDIMYNHKDFTINNIIQMDDGHLIVSSCILYVYKIKEKELEMTQNSIFWRIHSKKVFKLSNNIILFKNHDGIITFMKYQNGKLEELNEKPIKQRHITNILEINDNELALYYMDMNIFSEGYSTYIYFYDRKKKKKHEVEIGNVKNKDDSDIIPFELINGKYIITANSKNIILIDVKTYEKIKYFAPDKSKIYNFSITLLNKNNFLFLFKDTPYSEVFLCQYEFEENKKLVELKEKICFRYLEKPEYFQKYFENKLIAKKEKENFIEIYG